MTSPVAVIARFMPRPDARSALRALLDAMITPTRAEDGCRSYDLYESADGRRAGAFRTVPQPHRARRAPRFAALSELPGTGR